MSINPLNDISRVYLEQVSSQQLDEISPDLALAASKQASKKAGTLSALSAGDPKVKAKAVRKREQSERLYKKQAKKRVVNIKPIEEENVEEGVRPTPVEKPLDKAAFKKRRRSLAGKEASAEARARGHEGKTWADSGRTYSPDEAKSRRKNMSDTHRSLSYGTAESPDDNTGYPAVKTKNPKKLRKQKAMGEIGESAVPGKPAERLGAVTAIPKSEQDAARERVLAKAKAMRDKKGIREAAKPDYLDFDKDGNEIESMKKALKDKKKNKVEEANDGNLANNYPPYDKVTRGDVIAGATGKDQMGGKKKKITKEGYSNWREDLIEVVDKINNDENDEKITGENVDNTKRIKINPNLGEAVEELGGTLLEMVEIKDLEGVLDEMSESEIFLLNDNLIEEVVEEVFAECIEEGYDVYEIENVLLESLELSSEILNEAKVTLGHDTKIKSDRLAKVKSAVKKVGGAIARGAGYAAGAAVRGAKAARREFSAGYQKGSQGSSGSSSSGSSDSGSSTSSSQSGSSRPGLLGKIGSALKSGLKRVVAKGARAVSRGARNVARKMEGGSSSSSSTPTSTASAKPTSSSSSKPSDPWEGSATTPPKAKAKKASAPKAKAPAAQKPTAKKKKASKLDSLLADIRSEQVQIDEKTLTAAETKKKKEIYSSVTLDKLRKQYPEKSENELESLRFAISTSMAKKIAEQTLGMQAPAPAQEPKEKPLDTAAERQKFANLRTMQQKQQQLQKQRLNLQKQGKLPLENEFYEPEGEVLDERRRSEKGTPRKPRDPAFEYVAKMMGSSRLGVQPRGVKKQKGGPTSEPIITPAQKVAKRRADAQRAQEFMSNTRGT